MDPLELRPLGVTRVANTGPGLLLVGLGVVFVVGGVDESWIWMLLLGAASIGLRGALAVRAFRMRVIAYQDRLVIHGALRDRVVERTAIRALAGPDWLGILQVVWTDETGAERRSALTAVSSPPNAATFASEQAYDGETALRSWIGDTHSRKRKRQGR